MQFIDGGRVRQYGAADEKEAAPARKAVILGPDERPINGSGSKIVVPGR